jgi:hypothetical protein
MKDPNTPASDLSGTFLIASSGTLTWSQSVGAVTTTITPEPTQAEKLRKQAEEIEKESEVVRWIQCVLKSCESRGK